MTKEKYLSKLYSLLRWLLPAVQVRQIVADYDELFSVGIAEGKTEAVLCEEFGNVKQVAKSIWAERPFLVRRYLPIIRIALTFLLCFYFVIEKELFYSSIPIIEFFRITNIRPFWFIPALMLLITGEYQAIFKHNGWDGKLSTLHVGGAVLSIVLCAVAAWIVWDNLLSFVMYPASISPPITTHIIIIAHMPGWFTIAVCILWAANVLLRKRAYNCDSALYFVYSACAAALSGLHTMLMSLDLSGNAEWAFRETYKVCIMWMVIGSALCILWILALKIAAKIRKGKRS